LKINLRNEFKELPANTIGENLIRLRKLNDLTQEDISIAINISKVNDNIKKVVNHINRGFLAD